MKASAGLCHLLKVDSAEGLKNFNVLLHHSAKASNISLEILWFQICSVLHSVRTASRHFVWSFQCKSLLKQASITSSSTIIIIWSAYIYLRCLLIVTWHEWCLISHIARASSIWSNCQFSMLELCYWKFFAKTRLYLRKSLRQPTVLC